MILSASPTAPASPWKPRLQASVVHLGLSLAVAALAGALVFGVWYPYPYRETSGGRELFQLLVSVDVVVGPLITLVIFNPRKAWPVMRRDLAVVAVLQLAALGYGLWTVYVARPVHLVFEYNRFSVVHAIDVAPDFLPKAPRELQALPMGRPGLLSLRPFKDNGEMMQATMAAMAGVPLAARPDLWQSYAQGRTEVFKAAKPVADLKSRFSSKAAEIDALVASSGRSADSLGYVPMIDRKFFWTVLLDRNTAAVVGFLPLDSF